ncbi:MAG: hypothetical protein WC792_03085 [Candidatus Micrarchaeia archaeon]|jgi:CMP-N-acetylneuraminic acid synthetase
MAFENITAVIPVRANTAETADNSLLSFGDVTLLEWKIVQLLRVLPPQRIVLSTNSGPAEELAANYGVGASRRTDDECRDNLPFSETVKAIVGKIEAKDVAICPCVAPFLGPKEYESAFVKYNQNLASGNYRSLACVNEMREYVWDENRPLNYSPGPTTPRMRELPAWYRITNGLFIMSREEMLKAGYFIDSKPFLFAVNTLAGFDINYFDDYKITRELLSLYLSSGMGAGGR